MGYIRGGEYNNMYTYYKKRSLKITLRKGLLTALVCFSLFLLGLTSLHSGKRNSSSSSGRKKKSRKTERVAGFAAVPKDNEAPKTLSKPLSKRERQEARKFVQEFDEAEAHNSAIRTAYENEKVRMSLNKKSKQEIDDFSIEKFCQAKKVRWIEFDKEFGNKAVKLVEDLKAEQGAYHS